MALDPLGSILFAANVANECPRLLGLHLVQQLGLHKLPALRPDQFGILSAMSRIDGAVVRFFL